MLRGIHIVILLILTSPLSWHADAQTGSAPDAHMQAPAPPPPPQAAPLALLAPPMPEIRDSGINNEALNRRIHAPLVIVGPVARKPHPPGIGVMDPYGTFVAMP
jgi:hypothetical protein